MPRTVAWARRPVAVGAIAPVAAVSRPVGPNDWPRTIPIIRRAIRACPTSPIAAIVIRAAYSPVPSPSAPAPGLVGDYQGADADAYSEGDERRWGRGNRPDVNDGRIVDRNVDDLGIRGLNYVDGFAGGLLHLDLLLLSALQSAGIIGLIAQTLDGGGDGALIGGEGGANGGVVVNVIGHHGENVREICERDEGGIEALLLGGVGEGGARERRILREPVIHVQDFLRIGGGGGDLREQGIGIERDRSEQLVEFGGGGRRRGLRGEGRSENGQSREKNKKQNCFEARADFHGITSIARCSRWNAGEYSRMDGRAPKFGISPRARIRGVGIRRGVCALRASWPIHPLRRRCCIQRSPGRWR